MKQQNTQRGFSLFELIVVLAIIMIISAIAVPNIMTSWQQYRLNDAARQMSTLIQMTRYEAIKRNTNVSCRLAVAGGLTFIYIDMNGDGAMQNTESQVYVPRDMVMSPATAPAYNSMGLGATIAPAGSITFDGRGAVTFPVGIGAATYAFSIGYQGNTSPGYKAISLTPAGKLKVWTAAAVGNWHSP
ncbi:MAG: GspH/FimT family pseudopilin [Acidobacteria bacterium]|nr:GspH/FimT family pseudopilin [Acidobacteriota bacterium]